MPGARSPAAWRRRLQRAWERGFWQHGRHQTNSTLTPVCGKLSVWSGRGCWAVDAWSDGEEPVQDPSPLSGTVGAGSAGEKLVDGTSPWSGAVDCWEELARGDHGQENDGGAAVAVLGQQGRGPQGSKENIDIKELELTSLMREMGQELRDGFADIKRALEMMTLRQLQMQYELTDCWRCWQGDGWTGHYMSDEADGMQDEFDMHDEQRKDEQLNRDNCKQEVVEMTGAEAIQEALTEEISQPGDQKETQWCCHRV